LKKKFCHFDVEMLERRSHKEIKKTHFLPVLAVHLKGWKSQREHNEDLTEV